MGAVLVRLSEVSTVVSHAAVSTVRGMKVECWVKGKATRSWPLARPSVPYEGAKVLQQVHQHSKSLRVQSKIQIGVCEAVPRRSTG